MKKIILPLLYFLFLSIPILGQEVKKETLAIKTDESIIIDGQLNESIWEKAQDADAFIQLRPNREDPKKIKTSVKILYDDNYVYFGFLCYDTEPEKIEIGTIKKDGDIRDTDSIYILIDALFDTKTFFYFATNIIGSKSDGVIPKGGITVNYNWNGTWESFSQKTDFGWSTEVAIELSSIFGKPVENKTIGLSLSRVVPRLDISIYEPDPLESAFNINELRNLKLLELFETDKQIEMEKRIAQRIEQGKRSIITPYVITKLETGEKNNLSGGIDAQYAFSPQMFGQLTINPDFDTVEPDHEQVNLTPFELYLPERRTFFQVDSDIYQQPFGLFYSKRIGDIYGGVKLNGKFGASEFSLISAQTKNDEDLNVDSANFSVLSYKKKNILKFLTIGITAANKSIDKKNTGTAGIEAELTFNDKFRFSGQFALSYGDYGENNTAFFFGPSYDSSNFHIHLHYKQIDKYFGDNANYVGFIPDDNRKELDSAINKTFPFRIWILEQIRYRSNYNIYWGMDGNLRSWQIDEGLYLDLKNNKFTVSVLHTMEYKINDGFIGPKLIYIPSKDGWSELYTRSFRNDRTRFSSSFYNGEWQQFSLFITFGSNYGSKFNMTGISKKLEITKNIFSEYDFYHIRYYSESLYNTTYIHVLKLTFNMSEKFSWKVFYQSNKNIDKSNFHMVFTYTFKPPFGTFQLIYQKGTAEFGLKGTQGHTLFLKLGYMF
ncbi:MAG: carbohydrate binding family 9 domain-containing protein [Candidatus Aminicenantes bacterium]|nr:carbohydrate binding family 9 domain-containing protein [Candidatus Aminicenantes bacterium]